MRFYFSNNNLINDFIDTRSIYLVENTEINEFRNKYNLKISKKKTRVYEILECDLKFQKIEYFAS